MRRVRPWACRPLRAYVGMVVTLNSPAKRESVPPDVRQVIRKRLTPHSTAEKAARASAVRVRARMTGVYFEAAVLLSPRCHGLCNHGGCLLVW